MLRNRIYREYLVTDQMAILRQLGLDVDAYAGILAEAKLAQGLVGLDIGETGLALGQHPPEARPDLALASSDLERHTLEWMHDVWNRKMFGRIREVYAPTVQWHGPLMKELFGTASVTHQSLGLCGAFPDAHLQVQHVLLAALRRGRHQGRGALDDGGAPPRLRHPREPWARPPASGCR